MRKSMHPDFNDVSFEVVPIDKCFVPEYQRDLSVPWRDHLAEEWNSKLFRYPTLSRRPDGRLAEVDGHHTIQAAIERGHSVIPALVYDNLTEQEEAALYSDLNTQRRRPEAFDVWVADLIAERSWAVTLERLAREHGLVVAKGGTAPNRLRAIGALRASIVRGEVDLIDDALTILTSAWDDVDDPYNKNRVERALVLGMVDFIKRAKTFGTYDRARFIRRLRSATYIPVPGSGRAKVTSAGFQNYMTHLIQSGRLVLPALNSGNGQQVNHGKALAIAILGEQEARKVYAM